MSRNTTECELRRPSRDRGGRLVVLALSALMLAALGRNAMATGEHVDPKSMPVPVSEGEVPEPEGYRTDGYRMPVPRTLKGATVIDADAAEKLINDGAAIFLDVYPRAPKPPNLPAGTVWRDPPHSSIAGAHWLPNVGYGVLSPEFETYFKSRLETLTGSDKSKAVVFFCLKDCWMSWNAAKRALSWGYTAVMWFPDGTDGWQSIGNDLTPATPVP
jgi:PQQ-dependent catabolism-associated CXXCW motif protein